MVSKHPLCDISIKSLTLLYLIYMCSLELNVRKLIQSYLQWITWMLLKINVFSTCIIVQSSKEVTRQDFYMIGHCLLIGCWISSPGWYTNSYQSYINNFAIFKRINSLFAIESKHIISLLPLNNVPRNTLFVTVHLFLFFLLFCA